MARGTSLELDAYPPSRPTRLGGVPADAERAGVRLAGIAAGPEARPLRTVVLPQPDVIRPVRGWGRQHECQAGARRLPDPAVHGPAHRHLAVRPLLPRLRRRRS